MSKFTHICFLILLVSASLASIKAAEAETLDEMLLSIESRLALASYETDGRKHQKSLKKLLKEARDLHASHPGKPGAAAWHGIVARSYMDARGSSSSMRLAREARDALRKASDAPVRPGHPESDRARKLEVTTLLGMVEHRLNELT